MKSASENASQAAVEARSQGNRAQQVIFIVAAYIASTRLGGLGEVLRSDDPRPESSCAWLPLATAHDSLPAERCCMHLSHCSNLEASKESPLGKESLHSQDLLI